MWSVALMSTQWNCKSCDREWNLGKALASIPVWAVPSFVTLVLSSNFVILDALIMEQKISKFTGRMFLMIQLLLSSRCGYIVNTENYPLSSTAKKSTLFDKQIAAISEASLVEKPSSMVQNCFVFTPWHLATHKCFSGIFMRLMCMK